MSDKLKLILVSASAFIFLPQFEAFAASAEFRYNPSELSSVDGAEHLLTRIQETFAELCDVDHGGPKLVRERADRERCIVEGVETTVAQIDHANLDHAYEKLQRRE